MGEFPAAHSQGFTDAAWIDVIRKMDETYSELLKYQVDLEEKNTALEAMRVFIESVLGSMTDILIACDMSNHIVQTNEALVKATGIPTVELSGQAVADLFVPADRDRLACMLAAAHSKIRTQRMELAIQCKAEAEIFDIHAAPRMDPRGRVAGVVLIGRPVGELRRAYVELNHAHEQLIHTQQQLIHAEKMASLGKLVSGVAHEINNPVSFVYGNAHALERYVGRLEAYFDKVQAGVPRDELKQLRQDLKIDRSVANLREAVAGALEGAERVRDIVESLRRFSAEGHGKTGGFDLVGVTRTALAWVIRGHEPRLRATLNGPDRLVVEGRGGHIQQVIMNIIQNACDSMEDKASGAVSIAITERDGMATVSIADEGPGIEEAAMLRLFDPFFTTKPVGKGTGLGLSISYKIVQEHKGTLSAANRPEGGALFEMRIPIDWQGGPDR
jgi:two-component system sensor histidine kinase HupT/HoxJ